MDANRVTLESKVGNKIPVGATILKKDIDVTVEEIENGFILSKRFEIQYELNGETDWKYFTKKWFTKENPITIDEDVVEEVSLADKFD